jgi:formate/nitrite transporter FocA (FNT family)
MLNHGSADLPLGVVCLAAGFPVGLSMCVINGASLFTSNIAYMMAACIQRKSNAGQGVYVLLLSYFMNLAGEI